MTLEDIITKYKTDLKTRIKTDLEIMRQESTRILKQAIYVGALSFAIIGSTTNIIKKANMSYVQENKNTKKEKVIKNNPEIRTPFFYKYSTNDFIVEATKNNSKLLEIYPPETEHTYDTIFFPTKKSRDNFTTFTNTIQQYIDSRDISESEDKKQIALTVPDSLRGVKTYYSIPDSLKERIKKNPYMKDDNKILLTDIYIYDKQKEKFVDTITNPGILQSKPHWILTDDDSERKIKYRSWSEKQLAYSPDTQLGGRTDILDQKSKKIRQYSFEEATYEYRLKNMLPWYFGLMAVGAGALALRKKRRGSTLIELEEDIKDSKILSAIHPIAMLGPSMFEIYKTTQSETILQNPYTLIVGAAIITANTQMALDLTLMLKDHSERPHIKNIAKGFYKTIKYWTSKTPNEKSKFSEDIRSTNRIRLRENYKQIQKSGRYEEYFEKEIQNQDERFQENQLIAKEPGITLLKYIERIGIKSKIDTARIKLEYSSITKNHGKTMPAWEKLLEAQEKEDPKHLTEMKIFFAEYLESLDKVMKETPEPLQAPQYIKLKKHLEEDLQQQETLDKLLDMKTDKEWNSAIQSIIEHPQTRIENYKGKKVYRIGPSKIFRNVIALKTTQKEEIEKENETIQYARKELGEKIAPRPIAITEYEDKTFLISKFASGGTIGEIEKEYRKEAYKEMMSSLADIHNKLQGESRRDLLEILCSRAPNQQAAQLIAQEYGIMYELFNEEEVFEKDPHKNNWIYNIENKHTMAVDWDHNLSVPRYWELAKALVDESLDHKIQEELFKAYADKTNADKRLFNKKLENAAVGVAMNTKLINPGDPRNTYLLDNAQKILQKRKEQDTENRTRYEKISNFITILQSQQ